MERNGARKEKGKKGKKGKRAAPAIALNTKNCSTIEPARAAQAENNVTIETVKQIAVNLQAQIAQFGNMMQQLGAIENKEVQKYTNKHGAKKQILKAKRKSAERSDARNVQLSQ